MKQIKILSVALIGVVFLAACSKPAPKVEAPTPSAPEQVMAPKVEEPIAKEPESLPLPLPLSEPTPSSEAAGVDACALFTRSMAETLIGKVVMDPIATSTDGGGNCLYVGENFAGATLIVNRAADVKSAQDAYAESLAKFKEQAGVELESVSGLGDEAFWFGGKQNVLGVRVGQAWVVVGAQNPNGDVKAAVQGIAEQVLASLK